RDQLVGLGDMNDPLYSGHFQDLCIVHVAAVSQNADGGSLASGDRLSPETHILHRLDDGINIRLCGIVVHDNQHTNSFKSYLTTKDSKKHQEIRLFLNHRATTFW